MDKIEKKEMEKQSSVPELDFKNDKTLPELMAKVLKEDSEKSDFSDLVYSTLGFGLTVGFGWAILAFLTTLHGGF